MAHDLTPLKTVNPEKKATIVETPAQRLANLGITLPEPAAPIAAYVPTVEVNGLLHISTKVKSWSAASAKTATWLMDRQLRAHAA
jgi:hypothetical protein